MKQMNLVELYCDTLIPLPGLFDHPTREDAIRAIKSELESRRSRRNFDSMLTDFNRAAKAANRRGMRAPWDGWSAKSLPVARVPLITR